MTNASPSQLRPIVVISGGTGTTARQVLQAALAQFGECNPEIEYQAKVRSGRTAEAMVRDAAKRGALVCHSVVDPVVRRALDDEARKLGVPCLDVLGPALSMLSDHFRLQPRRRAGLLYELHREQLDRIDAVDFTLAHDDGKRLHELAQADIVVVGASRTSKSVTCFYLAARGVRAANVPLIPPQPVPRELLRLAPSRVVGLTMSAAHLESIRQTRLDRISHLPIAAYAELKEIRAELRTLRELMAERKWRCIDVSYRATEEVADQIVEMMPKRRTRSRTNHVDRTQKLSAKRV
jgi:regulator of PEP synthase PpsR (kinase-PPPase family)